MINVYECCLGTIYAQVNNNNNIENEAMSQQQKRKHLMKYLIVMNAYYKILLCKT